jgi:DNA ligase D
MPPRVERTNTGKVFWPDAGITKGGFLDYLDAVAPFLLRGLRGRPLTVIRFPDGVDGFSFYQKDTPKGAPPWVPTYPVWATGAKREVRYTVCGSKPVLMWLGNQAAVEFHPWLSRIDRIERPTHLVMDIDPPPGAFDRAVRVALLVRDALAEVGLSGAAKTSGSKGVHVYVPLQRRFSFLQVRDASLRLALRIEAEAPDEVTTAFRKDGRGDRVFLDTGRNAPGAHVVTAYSPRARPGAPVSFPVAWDALPNVRPLDFTIANVPGLLASDGDLWHSLMPAPQRLPRALLTD